MNSKEKETKLSSLSNMFASIEVPVIREVLESNEGDTEKTIDQLLTMSSLVFSPAKAPEPIVVEKEVVVENIQGLAQLQKLLIEKDEQLKVRDIALQNLREEYNAKSALIESLKRRLKDQTLNISTVLQKKDDQLSQSLVNVGTVQKQKLERDQKIESLAKELDSTQQELLSLSQMGLGNSEMNINSHLLKQEEILKKQFQQTLDSMEKEKEELKNEINFLKQNSNQDANEELLSQNKALSDSMNSNLKTVNEQQQNILQLQKIIEELSIEKKNLIIKQEELTELTYISKEQLSNQELKISALQEDIESLEDLAAKKDKEIQNLEQELINDSEEMAPLQEKLKDSVLQLDDQKKNHAESLVELNNLKSNFEKQSEELNESRKFHVQVSSDLNKTNLENKKLIEDKKILENKLEEEIEKYESQLQKKNQDLESSLKQLDILKREYEDSTQDMNEQRENFISENEKLNEKIIELSKETEENKNKILEFEKNEKINEEKLNLIEKEKNDLTDQLEMITLQLSSLETENENLKENINDLKNEIKSTEGVNESLLSQFEENSKKGEENNLVLDNFNSENKKLKEEIEKLRNILDDQKKESLLNLELIKDQKIQLDESNLKNNHYEKMISSKDIELSNMVENQEKVLNSSEEINKYKERINELEFELKNQVSKSEDFQKISNEQMSELRSTNDNISNQLKEARIQLSNTIEENQSPKQEFINLKEKIMSDLDELCEEKNQKDEEIHRLNSVINDSFSENSFAWPSVSPLKKPNQSSTIPDAIKNISNSIQNSVERFEKENISNDNSISQIQQIQNMGENLQKIFEEEIDIAMATIDFPINPISINFENTVPSDSEINLKKSFDELLERYTPDRKASISLPLSPFAQEINSNNVKLGETSELLKKYDENLADSSEKREIEVTDDLLSSVPNFEAPDSQTLDQEYERISKSFLEVQGPETPGGVVDQSGKNW